jgi:hypothetical protein
MAPGPVSITDQQAGRFQPIGGAGARKLPALRWLIYLLPLVLWAHVGSPAQAQQEWTATEVTVEQVTVEQVGVEPSGEPPGAPPTVIDVSDLAPPLYREEIDALARTVERAIVPVRAHFGTGNPLLTPTQLELDGFATLVRRGGEGVALVTASGWLEGAESVSVVTEDGEVPLSVVADARYGLALLRGAPGRLLQRPGLEILPVAAERHVEVLTASSGNVGVTLGPGSDQYGYYQVNSLSVIMGYPLVNRQGQLVGVGSHRYPLDPRLSLSVPAAQVVEFLETVDTED